MLQSLNAEEPESVMFAHDNASHKIIKINTETGEATVVGPTGFASGKSGLATARTPVPGPEGALFPEGTSFGLLEDQSLGRDFVVVVDVTTGLATKVVEATQIIGGRGVAFGPDGATLYVIENSGVRNRFLSTIDIVTGSVSPVGNTGFSATKSLSQNHILAPVVL